MYTKRESLRDMVLQSVRNPCTTTGKKSIIILILSWAALQWVSANGKTCCDKPDVQLTAACANGIAQLRWQTSERVTYGFAIIYGCNTNLICDHADDQKVFNRSALRYSETQVGIPGMFAYNLTMSDFDNDTCWLWIKRNDEWHNNEIGCSPVYTCNEVNLGPPMITLNCTTDYVTGRRSINATWQLQSFLPSDIQVGSQFNAIPDCDISITCRNGYRENSSICTKAAKQYGWKFSDIPLIEPSCDVTIAYDYSEDFLPIHYSGSANCSFPRIDIKPKIQSITENPVVGYFYEIQCVVEERINFVSINWIGPDGAAIVNNSRINITNTIVGNNHTSILQFAYLKETDNGSYNCNVAIQNNTFFSESFMLKDLKIPTPIVSVTATNNNPTIGESFSMECNVTVAKGIVGNVEITWAVNGTVKRRVTDTVEAIDSQYVLHRDVYNIPLLHASNNNTVYCCKAVINAREHVESNSSITLTIVSDVVSSKMITVSPTSTITTPTSTDMITRKCKDRSSDHVAVIISSIVVVILVILIAFLLGYCAYKILIRRRKGLNFTKQEDDDTVVSTI